jgi:hypothetical protein
MPEREQGNLPDWVEQERAGDMAWIKENLHVFWPAAQLGFETVGRGAVVVDTTARPTGAGHPFGYLDQVALEQGWDEDIRQMVNEYDPSWEMVTSLLKSQERVSTYRVKIISQQPDAPGQQVETTSPFLWWQKPFVVASVCREDLRGILTDEEIASLSDGEMGMIVDRMSDAYRDSGDYWEHLEIMARHVLGQEKGEGSRATANDAGDSPARPVPEPEPVVETDLEPPDLETLMAWEAEGGCEAACPHHCWTEPDGICSHGHPSWLLKLGLI